MTMLMTGNRELLQLKRSQLKSSEAEIENSASLMMKKKYYYIVNGSIQRSYNTK
jgi:hypothetical protein